ncbi:MAG: KH domain-containing protein [Fimbriimonadia bacterium]|jgi:hypothetical protein
MKKLVETLVHRVVDLPEQASIRESRRGDSLEYVVQVAPDDVGKIIGRRGRVADAIRTIVGAAAQKQHLQVHIKFDTG